MKIDFPKIQTPLSHDEIDLVAKFLKETDSYLTGVANQEFEDNFSKFLNVKASVSVSSGTAALECAAALLGLKEGDEVLIPAHTFTATALPFLKRGCSIKFIDLDPKTFVMCMNDLKKKISQNTKVVVPVHLYGNPVDMKELNILKKEFDFKVVEDCAQSLGASIDGEMAGSFGDFSCFSFNGQKNLTTLGEGGMLCSNNIEATEKIKSWRKFGNCPFEDQKSYWLPAMSNIVDKIHGEIPLNFSMSQVAAFAGNLVLKRFDHVLKSREKNLQQFKTKLSEVETLEFQKINKGFKSGNHLLPLRVLGSEANKKRDSLMDKLSNDFGIQAVIQYYPLYNYELFKAYGYSKANSDCPDSERFYSSMISLPFKTEMEESEINYICESIKSSLD